MSTRFINKVVVHTAAAQDGHGKPVYQTAAIIDAYHRAHNGWSAIGYHYVVLKDGTVELGRPESSVGAHVEGLNLHTIGICATGHGDLADLTELQRNAMVRLCAAIVRRYHLLSNDVIGHRETPMYGGPPVTKTCPGLLVDMDDLRQRIADRLENS